MYSETKCQISIYSLGAFFPHDSNIFYMRFPTTNEKRLDALLPTWTSGYLHEWLDSFFWNASLDH